MSVQLNRSLVQATINDPDCRGGLAIFLSQPSDGIRWNIRVYATLDEGLFEIGQFDTSIPENLVGPDNVRVPSRVVAMANCPGARSWTLTIVPVNPEDTPDHSTLSLGTGWCIGPPGVTRVGERYGLHSGGVDGVANIQAGERVVGWSAVAGPAGGTITFTPSTLPVITIPPNATVSGSTGGNLVGPVAMTFTGTIAHLVEVARSS